VHTQQQEQEFRVYKNPTTQAADEESCYGDTRLELLAAT
jgi:hypothetical protein